VAIKSKSRLNPESFHNDETRTIHETEQMVAIRSEDG